MKNIVCALLVVALFNSQLFAAGATPATDAKDEPTTAVKEEPKPEATVASPTPATPAGESKKLLVQRIAGVEVDEATAKTVEEAIVLNIGKRAGYSVVTSAEMESAIKFASK